MIVSNAQTQARRVIDHDRTKRQAIALQRQGKTLTEIAVELDRSRDLITQILYWEKVQP